ncbi:MAG: hypothetical protein WCR56_04395 [Bacilli bacterium]|jgi:hypothetical protein
MDKLEKEVLLKDYESPYMTKKDVVNILMLFNVGSPAAKTIYSSIDQDKKKFYKSKDLVDIGIRSCPTVLVRKYFDALGLTSDVIKSKLVEKVQ